MKQSARTLLSAFGSRDEFGMGSEPAQDEFETSSRRVWDGSKQVRDEIETSYERDLGVQ